MFCTKCGYQNPDDSKFCIKCGGALSQASASQQTSQPVYQPAVTPPTYAAPAVEPAAQSEKNTNGKKKKIAIIAIVVLLAAAITVGVVVTLNYIQQLEHQILCQNCRGVVGGNLFASDGKYFCSEECRDEYNGLNEGVSPDGNDSEDSTNGEFSKSDVPAGAVEFDGHWYCVYSLDNFSDWEEVEEFCADMNGYPATISSLKENTFVHDSVIDNYQLDNVYFGLVKNGSWSWSNGEEVTFENWSDESGNGEYAVFSPGNEDGLWEKRDSVTGSTDADIAVIKKASASSVLIESHVTHNANRIFDGDTSTAWVEGGEGTGIGDSITLTFDNKYCIEEFTINAGYQKTHDLYLKNSRPKEIQLTFTDGTSETHVLEDVDKAQSVKLNGPVMTDEVVITINSIYPGTKYEDTAIAEIDFTAYLSENYFVCEWGKY